MVLFENYRAIYEPFNKSRKIIGFDTFTGYTGKNEFDVNSEIFEDGNYSVGAEYEKILKELLEIHERNNILGHVTGVHELVSGDIRKTVIDYFTKNKDTIVALAYFDLGLYEPTKIALEEILNHVVPGSVILFDELTWSDAGGEAIAFKEVMSGLDFSIEKSKLTPQRSIVTINSI